MTQEFDRIDPVGSPPVSDTVARVVRSHPDTRQKKLFEAALKKKLEEEKKKQEERLQQDKVEISNSMDDENKQENGEQAESEQQPRPAKPDEPTNRSDDGTDTLDIKA